MIPLGIGVIGGGLLLFVCGVRDIDPRAVVLAVLTGDDLPEPGSGVDGYKAPDGRATPYTAPGGKLENGKPKGQVGGTVGSDTPGGKPGSIPGLGNATGD